MKKEQCENKSASVILNYMNYMDTISCVSNIIKMNAPLEIVIVDNNSPNDSFNVLKEMFDKQEHCHVIKNKLNAGYAAGNNVGIRYVARCFPTIEYVFIMNPDTIFDDPMLITKMENIAATHKDIAVFSPVMIQHGKEDFIHSCWKIPSGLTLSLKQLRFYHSLSVQKYEKKSETNLLKVDVVHGSFFMLRMDAVCEIGFLDENTFMYCEEMLLALDLKRRGYGEMILLDEHFFHNHPEHKGRLKITLKDRLLKEIRGTLHSRIYICKKHYKKSYIPLIYLTSGIDLIYITMLHLGYLSKRILKGDNTEDGHINI